MTLIELMMSLGVSVFIVSFLVGQVATQVHFMKDTSSRLRESLQGHQGVGVLAAWVGRAHRTEIFTSRSETVGGETGTHLRLDLPGQITAWAWIDSEGLWIEAGDGEAMLVSSLLRKTGDGMVFSRSKPTSPWQDTPSSLSGVLVYNQSFSGTGLVVMQYLCDKSPTVHQRALINIGL